MSDKTKEIRTSEQAIAWLVYEEFAWLDQYFPIDYQMKHSEFHLMTSTLLRMLINTQRLSGDMFANYQLPRGLQIKWELFAELFVHQNEETIANLFSEHPELVELVLYRVQYLLDQILWLLDVGKDPANDYSYVNPQILFAALQTIVNNRLQSTLV